jgi:hypothetical protein
MAFKPILHNPTVSAAIRYDNLDKRQRKGTSALPYIHYLSSCAVILREVAERRIHSASVFCDFASLRAE